MWNTYYNTIDFSMYGPHNQCPSFHDSHMFFTRCCAMTCLLSVLVFLVLGHCLVSSRCVWCVYLIVFTFKHDLSYKALVTRGCLALGLSIPCMLSLLQVALDLVNPYSVVDSLVNVLRPGSILAAYLPKLAPGNKYNNQTGSL